MHALAALRASINGIVALPITILRILTMGASNRVWLVISRRGLRVVRESLKFSKEVVFVETRMMVLVTNTLC